MTYALNFKENRKHFGKQEDDKVAVYIFFELDAT